MNDTVSGQVQAWQNIYILNLETDLIPQGDEVEFKTKLAVSMTYLFFKSKSIDRTRVGGVQGLTS